MNAQRIEDFLGSETTLYDVILVATCHSLYVCPNPLNEHIKGEL